MQSLRWSLLGLLLSGVVSLQTASAEELVVSSAFDGGSAEVLEIDQEKRLIKIRPAGNPQFGWPCWWYFQVTGLTPGEEITVAVDANQLKQAGGRKLASAWALPDQAAFSTNQRTWLQTPPGKKQDGTCQWKVKIDAKQAWFVWGPPYVPSDANALVKRLSRQHAHATSFELCKTRAGRVVPALLVSEPEQKTDSRMVIWVQARQHAWESGGSWVGQGFIEWVVSDDPHAVQLRNKADIYYVPIMDIDNVATGNGGKNQVPHDHNRDWSEQAQFNAVKTAMRYLKELDQSKRLVLFIDLHNPGSNSKRPFFFVAPPELATKRGTPLQDAFIAACRAEITKPFQLDKNTPSTGLKYDKLWKKISSNWIRSELSEHVVGITLETCWNTPHSNTTGYKTVGRQLGLGIARYLQTDPRQSGGID
ncbi:MAG: zinc carboxypeptidase [Planctomycetes bacterium]|nr:zinc carboxypeptidase [Planctomycetota bacterium]MCH9727750.1 zinc carboxypeptidase [Planctomycetota bacterium]MCH9776925.1 zinc carboxypeptidase [Planctomycetota bacterium]MCH9790238.1 zinc carboxypeptidase [Planctomycetota bacterium]